MEPFNHNASLLLHSGGQQLHRAAPSRGLMDDFHGIHVEGLTGCIGTLRPARKCHELPWRVEEDDGAGESERDRDREREGESELKQRLSDSAIYKAWPSACLINCALFWESRKLAGLQKEGDRKCSGLAFVYAGIYAVIEEGVGLGSSAHANATSPREGVGPRLLQRGFTRLVTLCSKVTTGSIRSQQCQECDVVQQRWLAAAAAVRTAAPPGAGVSPDRKCGRKCKQRSSLWTKWRQDTMHTLLRERMDHQDQVLECVVSVMPCADTLKWTAVDGGGGSMARVSVVAF
ncbi:hypothetical protein EYF80_029882 [Liparis tanakae]|uniref:Uncharacterized protein n=1 Tax=Liparis tanakae TaxID=230148 RepID=A0A4Z2H299_9TELE|nr:hypothetical protein EYF80_029882 [Liparis tanakae]